MNINDIYTSESNFLKASDLPAGREIPVIISAFEEIEMDQKRKIALRFEGKEKGLVLNKTNAMAIAHVNGNDTNDWTGKKIFIYSTKVDYAGQMVDAIRVRPASVEISEEDVPKF